MRLKRKTPNGTKSYSGLGAIKHSLVNLSNKVRKDELKAALPTQPGTRMTVNVTGNMRGMHMAENPPSSEEMKKKRLMRKLWNKQLPVLQCNNCAFSSQCPQYKASYECAFLPFLNSHQIENAEDLIFYAKEMAGQNIRRSQLAMMMETLSGQQPSLELSEQMGMAFTQLLQLHERMTAPDTAISIETDDRTIIGGLFGGLSGLMEATKKAQDTRLAVPIHADELSEGLLLDAPSTVSRLPEHAVNADLISSFAASTVQSAQGTPSNEAKP